MSTTAFSNNPVSMKYRGLLKPTKCGPATDNAWNFQLQYQEPMGKYDLATWTTTWGTSARPDPGEQHVNSSQIQNQVYVACNPLDECRRIRILASFT
ncbi:hypothetical protein E6W39_01425 [Kitasatospora acidiphila]|uniref:GNAT-like C-terminal domain-containing protein n=1 Tax=Kitasatospora acidiphila TaxID=2567942 RepID=A0A540VWK0_9ACTN|nr:hypothetical protein [Kitasatospora acidiphila]TQF01141.1 hypothetical protein E6W39_01425 [Kitasatospora acidiphila]